MSAKSFPWWTDTITIYNKYEDATTQVISWYKHTVNDCFWKYDGVKIAIGSTVLEGNSTICRIPEDKNFLERYQWEALTNDNMSNYFTLGVGDIIVKGAVDDIIDEYQRGHRASDLLAKYKKLQGCIEIQSVSINTGDTKCVPHYFVRGE